ncbi:hypothetical protein AAFF_G00068850 [Aldrovandia affinis]|uniref:Uncharacterized protein n=1 Tax=Aldrovandia affinis TaxID=143900 RepID=A0AAD7WDC4_9TELE|nr:hypothetical protein AAFF_G00068850 [Aldrovandia affinis]
MLTTRDLLHAWLGGGRREMPAKEAANDERAIHRGALRTRRHKKPGNCSGITRRNCGGDSSIGQCPKPKIHCPFETVRPRSSREEGRPVPSPHSPAPAEKPRQTLL